MELVCREFHHRLNFVKIPGIISPIARKVVIIFKYLALKRDTQSTILPEMGSSAAKPHPIELSPPESRVIPPSLTPTTAGYQP